MKKILAVLLLLVLAAGLFSACSSVRTEALWAYDTTCTAKVWGGGDWKDVFVSAAARGERLLTPEGDKQIVASRDGETVPLSEEMLEILRQAEVLYRLTGGVYDLTVAPLSDLWDVTHAQTPPAESEIGNILPLVGFDGLTVTDEGVVFAKAGMGIDIGSVGKGYGGEITAKALQNAGAEGGVISFGGNVVAFGTREGEPFRIGVKDPRDGEGTFCLVSVTDCSVVTSGPYERYFEYDGRIYHHLLDPGTGYPRESDLLSVTVFCENGAQADMMSTALWLMGETEGWKLYETLQTTEGFAPSEVIFVCKDDRVLVSDGLKNAGFELVSGRYTMG